MLYEVFAVAFVVPALGLVFNELFGSTLALAASMSAIALAWNCVFNTVFERWEARQAVKGRSLARRLVHGMGFEGGLVVILVPVMATWLGTSWFEAFVADLGLFVFFYVYAIAFTWAFDKLFGLPQSAAENAVMGSG